MSFLNGGQKPNGSTLPGVQTMGKSRVSTLPGVDPTIPTGTQPPQKWGATLGPDPYAMEQIMGTMAGISPMMGLFARDGHHERIENRKRYFAANRQARAQAQPGAPQTAPNANFLGQLQGLMR